LADLSEIVRDHFTEADLDDWPNGKHLSIWRNIANFHDLRVSQISKHTPNFNFTPQTDKEPSDDQVFDG
jgi:hypothetical protein